MAKELPRYPTISSYEFEMKKKYGSMLDLAFKELFKQLKEWNYEPVPQPDLDGNYTKSDRGVIGDFRKAPLDLHWGSIGSGGTHSQGQSDIESMGSGMEEISSES